MHRRTFMMGLLTLPAALSACSSAPDASDALVGGLTSSLGVTENQAMGGVGSMLTLAQEKLASGQFNQVTKFLPGASKYMDLAKNLGAVTGPLGGMSGLTSAMGKLGMSPDTVSKFVPSVTDYVSKVGGSGIGSMFAGVFK